MCYQYDSRLTETSLLYQLWIDSAVVYSYNWTFPFLIESNLVLQKTTPPSTP
jgi:hypothetical protein